MALVQEEVHVGLSPKALRVHLFDPVAWVRHHWGDELDEVLQLDENSVRLAFDPGGQLVIRRVRHESHAVEYVIPPQGVFSLERRVGYELHERTSGTAVVVSEAVDASTGFKLASLGVYLPLVSFIARRNLRHHADQLARLQPD